MSSRTQKSPADKLQTAITKILEEYGEEIGENLDEAVKKVGKAGTTALRQNSSQTFGGTGQYARGWKVQVETGRTGTKATIYNQTPGLPHLLENGHAKRGGGRVSGRPHIQPVEQQLIDQFEEEVTKAI